MTRLNDDQTEFSAYGRLAEVLRELPAVAAPPDLGERALARVAQSRVAVSPPIRYTSLETALGTLYLAYGPKGIRSIAPAESPAAFAEGYATRFGVRPLADEAPPERLLADLARALA